MNGKISNYQQIASIRRYVMSAGREKGIEVIDCDNGKIRFLLNVTKALDIMQLYHEGQNVSFLSKNAFTNGEVPFLERFEGGMLYTCGLDSVGNRDGFELHGRVHNLSAEIVVLKCDNDGILVEGIIRDTSLFGQNLVLKRKIFSKINSDCLEIEDVLINQGYKTQDFCLLYHVNVGYPMLDSGAKIIAEESSCIPRTPYAEKLMCERYEISSDVATEEVCYFLTFKKPTISCMNEKLGKKFTLSYSKETLPCFVEWKSMCSGDYALGLEPSTTFLDDKFKYTQILAGKEIKFNLKLCVQRI